MYLACTFLRNDFSILPRSARSERGPDICIKDGDADLWIEAVAPEKGDGQDAVPEMAISSGGLLVPEKEIILRFRSAIEDKYKKYQEYSSKGMLKDKDPYIIAVNGGRVPFAFLDDEEDEVPLVIKALFPCGDPQAIVNRETLKIIRLQYEYRSNIIKKSGCPVSTNIFLDKKYNGISAVLFSSVDAVNRSEILGDDFIIVHNHIAMNPIQLGYINIDKEYWIDSDRNDILRKREYQKTNLIK